jgi:ribosomal protein S20
MLNIRLGNNKEEIKSNLKSIKEMEKDRQINKFLDPESKMERIEQDSDKMIEIECEEKMEEMIQSLLESGSDKEVEDH